MGWCAGRLASRAIVIAGLLGMGGTTPFASDRPSRFALMAEGGTAWESRAPQPFFLAVPVGGQTLIDYDRGVDWGVALETQLNQVFVLRTGYDTGNADLSITLLPPPGIADDADVANARYRSLRVGVFFHALSRRDLFDPDAETRTLGRFGVSVARSGLTDVELEPSAAAAFGIESFSTRDAWTFDLEAEWIARLGRSRWFAGLGIAIGVGPGPKLVLEPGPGSDYVSSEFECRQNRLMVRLGYRF